MEKFMSTENTQYTEKHLELVRELQKIQGLDKLAEMTANEGVLQWRSKFSHDGESEVSDEDLPPNFVKMLALVEKAHHDEGAKNALTQIIEQLYLRTFTEAELTDIVAFAATDGGKKALELGGLRMPDSRPYCWAWSAEVQKRFCSTPEFTELANGVDTSAQPAQELAPGQSVEQPQP